MFRGKKPNMGDDNKKNRLKDFALLSSAGIMFPLSIAAGYYIGNWLDKKLSTEPIFLIVFLLFGIAAGFINFFRVLKQIER
jgi:ATP synthase protein I